MAKKILIVIDPGHYPGYNKGVAPGYYEGDKMYTLSEYEKKALEGYGFDVVITRDKNKDMALRDRGRVAITKGKGYDTVVFISNHTKAGTSDAKGVELYRSKYLPDSVALADKLVDATVKVMRAETGITYDRGVKTRTCSYGDYYGVIRGAVGDAPSIAKAKNCVVEFAFLIEHGFHTNKKECEYLNVDSNLKELAEAKAKVFADYFGYTKKAPVKTETKEETKSGLFRVRKTWKDEASQIGAFSSITNAKKLANKNPGYSVFDDVGVKLYTSKATDKTVKKGSKVKVKSGAKDYNGKSVASFVYKNVYTVDELKGKSAVLDKDGICTAFNVDDLIAQ